MGDVGYPELDQVAGAQLGVDRQIEQGEVPDLVVKLEPDSDGPNIFEPERRFLTDQLSLVPGFVRRVLPRFHGLLG